MFRPDLPGEWCQLSPAYLRPLRESLDRKGRCRAKDETGEDGKDHEVARRLPVCGTHSRARCGDHRRAVQVGHAGQRS